jgi:hypothetical protein
MSIECLGCHWYYKGGYCMYNKPSFMTVEDWIKRGDDDKYTVEDCLCWKEKKREQLSD